MGKLISLAQWAASAGITPETARQRAKRGAFKTAKKIGRNWVIDEDETLIDHRTKEAQMQQDEIIPSEEDLKKQYAIKVLDELCSRMEKYCDSCHAECFDCQMGMAQELTEKIKLDVMLGKIGK